MDRDQLALVLAHVERASLRNVLLPKVKQGMNVVGRGVDAIRGWSLSAFRRWVDRPAPSWLVREIGSMEIVHFQQQLERRQKALMTYERHELVDEFVRTMAERVGDTADDAEVVLQKACHIAAKGYKLDVSFPSVYLASLITHRYLEEAVAEAVKAYGKMSSDQQVEVERRLDVSFSELDIHTERQLAQSLGVQRVTGASVMKALSGGAGAYALATMVKAAGFSAYVAMSTIIHAVFTTFLGVTVPFAAYSAASTTLAFLTGPLGWFLIIGVMTAVILRRGDRGLNHKVLAFAITIVYLSMNQEIVPKDSDLSSEDDDEVVS